MANVSSTPKFAGMKYRVVNTLGTGAGSTILLISDKTAGGKRYALKVVRKQEPEDEVYVQQALTEFEAAKKLNHPAIAKVFDCRLKKVVVQGQGGRALDGIRRGQDARRDRGARAGQLVLMFCQVASALTHMHRRGVYHGDLKPGNIMLAKNGQVKLIDFGTAWVRGQDKNRIQGTPQYIAPEQADREGGQREDRHLQPRRHDVPHVHRPVCPAGHPQARRRSEAGPPIKINPRIPGALNELIIASLSIDPSKRPAGMFEIRDQLSAVAKQMGLAEVDSEGADEED